MEFALIFCVAILLDNILGDSLRITHPVVLIGRVIDFLRARISRIFKDADFANGLLICVCVVAMSGVTAGFLLGIFPEKLRFIAKIYALYAAIAWRDLKDETFVIYESLANHDLELARKFLARVVGRDVANLDEGGISRAAIETVGENSVDAIFSVMFWALIGNLLNHEYGAYICVWLFKAASTLDSMIGYEKFGRFGFCSARLDDAMNFLPARIGGFAIIFAGKLFGNNFADCLRIFLRDRLKHKSPNSAHGEAAFAGVLQVRLGGGAYYSGEFSAREFLGAEFREAEALDILRAHRLLDISASIFAIMCVLIAICV